MNDYTTVIAAVSTPPGKGGVAIIRISGEGAVGVASRVFFPRNKKSLAELPPRTQVWGDIFYGEEQIDDGMVTVFRAPHSYTGEDTVEISCHGGELVSVTVLEAVLFAGARQAEAGEFTRRAFINGKISLSEAEAIGNLLEADTRDAIRISAKGSRTRLSEAVEDIRLELVSILSSIYARIDYPDEELGDFTDEEIIKKLIETRKKAQALSDTYRMGKALTEGVKATICGKPNVGKSSVYNALVGREAAIVTDIEGTTRDVLNEKIMLGRVALTLSDTAGIREGEGVGEIEKIGIMLSHKAISDSELIIAVFDSSMPLTDEDLTLLSLLSDISVPKIAILNKADKGTGADLSQINGAFDYVISTSAKCDKDGTKRLLSDALEKLFIDEKITVGNDAIIANARQSASLMRAISFIGEAIRAFSIGMSQDASSSEIELALGAIAELDGRAVTDEVVSDIFKKFCVGK